MCGAMTATLVWMSPSLSTGLASSPKSELECVPPGGHCYDNFIKISLSESLSFKHRGEQWPCSTPPPTPSNSEGWDLRGFP